MGEARLRSEAPSGAAPLAPRLRGARRQTVAEAAAEARCWRRARPDRPDHICLARCRVLPGGVTEPAAAALRTAEPQPMRQAVGRRQLGAHCTSDHPAVYVSATPADRRRSRAPYSQWRGPLLRWWIRRVQDDEKWKIPTCCAVRTAWTKARSLGGNAPARKLGTAVSCADLWKPDGSLLRAIGRRSLAGLHRWLKGGSALRHPSRAPEMGGTSRTTTSISGAPVRRFRCMHLFGGKSDAPLT